jgi:LuxR family maltose regulon positive regulatory protein
MPVQLGTLHGGTAPASSADPNVVELPSRRRLPAHRLVDRPSLVSRLANSTAPITVLTAPAGYGKTTLLAQWERCDARPFAWIDAGVRHDDPLAAEVVGPGVRQVRAPTAAALPRLLAAVDDPIVLVLDDAQAPRSAGRLELVPAIAARLPPGSIVVIASRREPRLPIRRLRALGSVLELRAADLVMTADEASELLRLAGLDVERSEIPAVLREAEGWPVALRLAALALLEQRGDAPPCGFRGDDRILADYVFDELLRDLDPDEQQLLIRTSPFERLSGPLCDAVLGRRGSGVVLRRLSRNGVPLAPLDRGDEEFRLHRVVRETLHAELRRAEPQLEPVVHGRASGWFEDAGDGERAVDAAIGAGDAERAEELLGRLAPTLAFNARLTTLERWLHRLGEHAVAARPALAIAAATSRVARGDRDLAEHWTAMAEGAAAPAGEPLPPALAAAAAALRAATAMHGNESMRHQARRCRVLASGHSPWRAVGCLLEGVALHLGGRGEDARTRLEQAARLGAAQLPLAVALSLAQLTLMARDGDDLDDAADITDRLLAVLTGPEICESAPSALAFAVAADALAGGGRVDEARDCARRALRLSGQLADAPPWYDAELRIALARAQLSLSQAAAARESLTKASRAARHLPERTILQRWIDDAWGRADMFAAGAGAGIEMLTIAELRVLRFLPSHLSFREIATRLHVSPNTVKTQAHAVYRKLDASSRSEAVGRAREFGLVEG